MTASVTMSSAYYDYYDGSKLFLGFATKIGLPIDLVNFLIAQIAALCLARLFRKPLRLASPEFRHSVCLVIGLVMGYFCFGKQSIHLSILPMLSYSIMKTLPHHVIGNAVLAVAMLYLSCIHLHRQIYHTADYTLDISGPLMVITQRVTSLAYSLQDNLSRKEINENTTPAPRDSQEAYAQGKESRVEGKESRVESKESRVESKESRVERMPSPLEYFSFTLAFQTLMCGPVVFYPDYIRFIESARAARKQQEAAGAAGAGGAVAGAGGAGGATEPSPRRAVLLKAAGSLGAALLYLTLARKYPLAALRELCEPSSEVSCAYLVWYAYLATLVVRCKYYHAWLLSEAICNNCGLGFNGYDAAGRARWDKISNIDVLAFEFAQNFRTAIASWNKNTNAWLRGVAYSRGAARSRTARVFALSALWHGFHPGYYLTFLAGGLFTVAARKVRGAARPLFLGSRPRKLCYDAVSFLTTRVAMTYATVPFVLLHLAPSLAFYSKLHYSLHLAALGALLLPARRGVRGDARDARGDARDARGDARDARRDDGKRDAS